MRNFWACILIVLATGALPMAAVAQPALDFELDRQKRASNFARLAEDYAATNAGLGMIAREIVQVVQQENVIDDYFAGYGMRSDDLGDVLAMAYFSAVMLADGGRTDDPTQAQIDGLRALIDNAVGDSFASFGNAQKQDMADQLLMSVLVQNAVAEGIPDRAILGPWLDEFAQFNTALLGFDVTQMRIGPNGFANMPAGTATSTAGASFATGALAQPASRMATGRDEIVGVGFDHQLIFMPGFNGGSLQSSNTLTVLLRDGRACEDCLSEVLDGTLASFARENPDEMGRWRKVGADYQVTFADGETTEIEAKGVHGPAPAGTVLNGNFKGVSGTSVGIASTLTIDFLNFRPDGTFVADGGTSSVGAYAIASVERASQTGRYSIDGYRIILEFANGAREEQSFVLYDTDDEFIIIDGLPHFVPDDD